MARSPHPRPRVPHRSRARRGVVAALTGLGAASLLAAATVAASPRAAAEEVRIHDIQGTTRLSPYVGQTVTDVPGVVTGVRTDGSAGFWFQDPHGDGDPATSEGLFVYTQDAPTVAVGDEVLVSGEVGEYYPGGEEAGGQSVTQIAKPSVTVVSSGHPLPTPFRLGQRAVPDAYAPTPGPDGGEIEDLPLRPDAFALDRYESLEGMNVRVGPAPVVGPTTDYDELWVAVATGAHRTVNGGVRYASYATPNPGRLKVTTLAPTDREHPFPAANVGDTLAEPLSGPLDYDQFGGYLLAARQLPTVRPGDTEPERARPHEPDELSLATYNVENLHPGAGAETFERLASGVVDLLASPDVVALEEIQDNSGPTDDGTVAADETLALLSDAIAAAGGPRYDWRGIDPVDGADGGQPGGNIRTVFLFNPERVTFVDRPGGDATTATEVVRRGGEATLSLSPGRVAPGSDAWVDSRKPLAGEFRFRGETVIVIANHFASKGGDQPLHARHQPPQRGSEAQRLAQAEAVNAFVRDIRAAQPDARAVVLGDLNDFEFSATTQALTAGGVLRGVVADLPPDDRYTYVFDGNAQVLDQTLVTPAIRHVDYDIVHVNADFADQVSDHDPQLLRFTP